MTTYWSCTYIGLVFAAVAGAANLFPAAAQPFREVPPDIIAVQLRSQGFACERPVAATRDTARSRPDQPVWTLTCQNATYRVRLTGGMAAKVARLK